MRAYVPGFKPAEETIRIEPNEPIAPVEFRLLKEERGPVRGVVLNAETRKPIPGAYVRSDNAETETDTLTYVETATSKDGQFTLSGLPSGTYKLRAWAPHLKRQKKEDIVVHEGEKIEEIEILLEPRKR